MLIVVVIEKDQFHLLIVINVCLNLQNFVQPSIELNFFNNPQLYTKLS